MASNNQMYIIQGEVSLLLTAMKRTVHYGPQSYHEEDNEPMLRGLSQLKDVMNNISDLGEIEASTFLNPFLEVVRSEETTGPITGFALTSINKFLSYGLISPTSSDASIAIENIADAVTHARFVGTDPSADEVVLMKILHVLRTLLLVPAGILLSNEAVCEIMQSCFRICFETRLSELLRKSAECTLMDMVQLLFARLPQLKEDPRWVANMTRKLKMRKGGMESNRGRQRRKGGKNASGTGAGGGSRPKHLGVSKSRSSNQAPSSTTQAQTPNSGALGQGEGEDAVQPSPHETAEAPLATTPVQPPDGVEREGGPAVVVDLHREGPLEVTGAKEVTDEADGENGNGRPEDEVLKTCESETNLSEFADDEAVSFQGEQSDTSSLMESEYVNSQGVRFTSTGLPSAPGNSSGEEDEDAAGGSSSTRGSISGPSGGLARIPYGLPCVRELLRFLVSLTNPHDRHNSDIMIHMGISLLTVALESGADSIPNYKSLISLVRDDMCKNLISLLHSERLSLFAASQRVCFLLFESMRSHLKFQLEMYLLRLMEIITSDTPRITFEQREVALESIVQLWRIPGLVTELYLNYDCDMYCSNLFEDLTKLLSKNAFPVSGLYTTHLLSLDALLTVIDTIEQHCHSRVLAATTKSHGLTVSLSSASITSETDGGDHRVISAIPEDEEEAGGGAGKGNAASGPAAAGAVAAAGGGGYQPAVSGFHAASRLTRSGPYEGSGTDAGAGGPRESRRGPQIRPNRMRVSDSIPNEEELATAKHKKRLLQAGTEKFNTRPKDGIEFLQSHGLLSTPLNPKEVVTFLRENPRLDKRMIGEYISKRGNSEILNEFAKSFNFEDVRIDDSLRQYVETFRLPGEAPLIQLILESFSEAWHRSNREPFANTDAAFTLAYAVLMLNTDQHNMNSRKQNVPMKPEDFKRNLKDANGGNQFEADMLEEIYWAIHNDEIVLPAEQTGVVRENYLWKVLLRRGASDQGNFIHAPTGAFDHDLFALIWGPTVAALSFVFDKTVNEAVATKSIAGFRKCAMISAHYGLSDVFDNLVISLCKFTTLLSSVETGFYFAGANKNPDSLPVLFGRNFKAQLAARAVFGLAYRHGDILRDGWKNLLDCLLQLFKAKLLPEVLVEVEDFVDPHGRIRLLKEESSANQKQETGMLSSFYHYFTSDSASQRGPSAEEQEAKTRAIDCVQDCHIEQLLQDSKFLRVDSLTELVKALLVATKGDCTHDALANHYDEEARVFYFEMLMRVLLQNRDRLGPLWGLVREHFYMALIGATEPAFLLERTVAGLLRLANRLLRREEMTPQVFSCLHLLVLMKPSLLYGVSRQLIYGLYEVIHTHAPNIHSSEDWQVLFTLLEVCGAGCTPPALYRAQIAASLPDEFLAHSVNFQPGCPDSGLASSTDGAAQSDSELSSPTNAPSDSARGYISDSELYEASPRHHRNAAQNWVLMDEETAAAATQSANQGLLHGLENIPPVNPYSIVLQEELRHHDSRSLFKASETLAFLVRDAAHVTPANFEACVHTVRLFVEASLNGGRPRSSRSRAGEGSGNKNGRRSKVQGGASSGGIRRSKSSGAYLHHSALGGDSTEEEERSSDHYHSVSMQLLDLMHTLHSRAAPIYSAWAGTEKDGEEAALEVGPAILWDRCWCPLLQGIARLGCDTRRQVRSQAMTYLHRALLDPQLQKQMGALEWESCFNKVLFPLLSCLLENINPVDPSGMEETRSRAVNLLSRVFLQHLGPLFTLPTFLALWLTILDFLDKYMHSDKCELLKEAIPESLKNMLLVMDTANILRPQTGLHVQMWQLTWHRVSAFLPNFRDEIFPAPPPPAAVTVTEPQPLPPPEDTPSSGTPAEPASAEKVKEDVAEENEKPTEDGADTVVIEMETAQEKEEETEEGEEKVVSQQPQGSSTKDNTGEGKTTQVTDTDEVENTPTAGASLLLHTALPESMANAPRPVLTAPPPSAPQRPGINDL